MILFIDTSKPETKIALYKKSLLLAQKTWLSAKNQSEELLFEIDKLLKQNRVKKSDLKKILAVNGPGSYTGLRVGLSTANILAYSLKIEIIGIDLDLKANKFTKILEANEGVFQKPIMPIYGYQPKITKPRSRR